ncbi:MAG: hypothetical protein R2799_12585 [Crocinitomicaceae bacterium]
MNHQEILEKLVEETLKRDFQLLERKDEQNWEDSQIQALSEMTQFNEIEIRKILLETKKLVLEKQKKKEFNLWWSVSHFLLILGIIYLLVGVFIFGPWHSLYAFGLILTAVIARIIIKSYQRQIIIDPLDGSGYRWSQNEDRKVYSCLKTDGYYFQSFGKCYSDKYTPDVKGNFIAELNCRWESGEYDEYGLMIGFENDINIRFIVTGKGSACPCIYDTKKKDFIDNFSWKRDILPSGRTRSFNSLKVQKEGHQFTYWVNDKLIETFTQELGPPTYFSIRSCGDQTVVFESLRIKNFREEVLFKEKFMLGQNKFPVNERDSFNYLKKMTPEGYLVQTNREDYNYWSKREVTLKKSWDIQIETTQLEGETEWFGIVLEKYKGDEILERLYCYIKQDGSGELRMDTSISGFELQEKFSFEVNSKNSYRITLGYRSDLYKTKGIFLAINHTVIFTDLKLKLPDFTHFGMLVSGYQTVRFNNLIIDKRN